MRIWDCHVHCHGDETGEAVLAAMDQAGIERISLFGRYPGDISGPNPVPTRERMRETIDHLAAVQTAAPERIYGLLWADPRIPGMVEEIEYGIGERGLRGVKMIPDHWYPSDEIVFPVYEKMQELRKPIQYHSGILYGFGDSSRFCRPVFYEAMINFPKLRFALAHISWPWTDECIAVFGRCRAAARDGRTPQMWIDTSRGTPDAWRLEALQKAIPFCGLDRLMYGTDTYPASLAQNAPVAIRKDTEILHNVIGVSDEQMEMFFWGAAEAFFKTD